MKLTDEETRLRNAAAREVVIATAGRAPTSVVTHSWKVTNASGERLIVAIFDDGEAVIGAYSHVGSAACTLTASDLAQLIHDCQHALAQMRRPS